MGKDHRPGQMEPSMKDNGKMTKFKAKEGLFMLIMISMRENLSLARQMGTVNTLREEARSMKEH